jgi:glycosyltransferase involved in cell wall biosynthesis
MIPTYNPPAQYLEETLRSVLAQDPGPDQMQIEIVDDCSPNVDVAAFVKRIAGERVKVSQTPKNLGLAGCWNTCIAQAQGDWVHLLHQDDIVYPGFYEKLKNGILTNPSVRAAFCRTAHIDDQSKQGDLTPLVQETAGVAESLAEQLASWQLIQFAALVVHRDAHSAVGPFNAALNFVIDWEMWLRIALRFPVWFEPLVLAGYRLHGSTETSRLKLKGTDIREVRQFLSQSKAVLQTADGRASHSTACQWYALRAVELGTIYFYQKKFLAAGHQFAGGIRLCPRPRLFGQLGRFGLGIFAAGWRRLFLKPGIPAPRI